MEKPAIRRGCRLWNGTCGCHFEEVREISTMVDRGEHLGWAKGPPWDQPGHWRVLSLPHLRTDHTCDSTARRPSRRWVWFVFEKQNQSKVRTSCIKVRIFSLPLKICSSGNTGPWFSRGSNQLKLRRSCLPSQASISSWPVASC